MNRSKEIIQELTDLESKLTSWPTDMPFAVPDGYFEDFKSELTKSIVHIDSPDVVPGWPTATPYTVPDNYFNTSADTFVANAMSTYGIANEQKGVPYNIPTGYFESFPEKTLAAAKQKERTIKLKPNPFVYIKSWVAAAVILVTIGFGYYDFFINNGQNVHDKMLANVPANEIKEYLQNANRIDVDRIFSNTDINNLQLENMEIIDYLNESGWEL